MKPSLKILAGLAALLSATVASAAMNSVIASKLKSYDLPVFPLRAQMEGILSGEVHLLIDISAEGEVVDTLTLSATNVYFVAPAERAVRDWVFIPSQRDGEKVPSILALTFSFDYTGVNAGFGPSVVLAFLNDMRADMPMVDFVARLSELDSIPAPLDIVRPGALTDVPPDDRTGRVVFQFFIDQEGKVRMPVVVEQEGDIRLAESALYALEHWRFAPPKAGGRPVIAQARQEFIFQGE